MLVSLRGLVGARFFLPTLVVLFIGSGCGDGSSSDPTVVNVKDLKTPGALTVQDHGDGSVTLTWIGSNFEEKFQGYNVYVAEGTADELGVTDGEPLKLLDQSGEPSSEAKTVLAKFDYKDETGATAVAFNKLAEDEEGSSIPGGGGSKPAADDEPKFSYLPLHKEDAEGEPILPTCQPTASGTCEVLTSEAMRQEGVTLNGATTLEIEDLTPGKSYCFLVFSVQDEGAAISQTSSEVNCLTPRFEQQASLTASNFTSYDLYTLSTECAAGTCPTISDFDNAETTFVAKDKAWANKAFHLELISGKPYFATGKNATMRDLGYMEQGFSDPKFAALKNESVLTKYTFNDDAGGASTNKVSNANGFLVPYYSTAALTKHMYVVAVADPAATGPTTFFYHYLWVNSVSGGTAETTLRYSLQQEAEAE